MLMEECTTQKDKDTLLKTLDIFFDQFNTIDIIQLFGGEPTINLEAVEIVGSYIESKLSENKIKHRPILCLTTNGMCASDEFIRLVKKYEIKITVSIDGPPAITNQTRLDRKGKGVAETLERNIKKLQKYTGEPKSAEVTFTQCHIDKGITVRDTIRYINEKFGIMDVHVAPVSAPDGAAYKLLNRDSFLDMIPSIIKSRENGFMLVNRVIRNLCIKQATRQICGAGTAVYSVSATGDIYPCFMLTDINEFKLGNIHSINESFWDIAASPLKQYYTFNKFKYEQCADCFNRAICNGCMGINYYSKGDIFHTPDEECEFFKALTENVIIALVESKHN